MYVCMYVCTYVRKSSLTKTRRKHKGSLGAFWPQDSGRPGCFFFVVAPFCSCPVSLVSRACFAVVPGCAKCFFWCAPLGAASFRRGQSKKKKTPPRVFFFAPAPAKVWGRRSPFCSGPVPAPNGASPSPAFRRAGAKKNTLGGVFFALAPPKRRGAQRGATQKKTLCTPGDDSKKFWKPMTRGTSKKGPQQQKNDSLTEALDRDAHSLLFRSDFSGWCFFFAAAPRGRSLTHCGRCGPARTGVVCFFCCGPARTLTHSLWAGAISARPWCVCVCFFFLLRPRRTRRANNKKIVWCTTSGLKRPGGATAKKKHTTSDSGTYLPYVLGELGQAAPYATCSRHSRKGHALNMQLENHTQAYIPDTYIHTLCLYVAMDGWMDGWMDVFYVCTYVYTNSLSLYIYIHTHKNIARQI